MQRGGGSGREEETRGERKKSKFNILHLNLQNERQSLTLYVMVLRACKSSRNILIFWKKEGNIPMENLTVRAAQMRILMI